MLLHLGSSPLLRDSGGLTPFYHSAANGNLLCTRLLLANISVNVAHQLYMIVNMEDGMQRTALHHACYNGQPDIVTVLMEYGASPNSMNSSGNYPIHVACMRPSGGQAYFEVIRILLNFGASRDRKNNSGQTASEVALMSGNIELSDFVKKHAVMVCDHRRTPALDQLIERDRLICTNLQRNVTLGEFENDLLSGIPTSVGNAVESGAVEQEHDVGHGVTNRVLIRTKTSQVLMIALKYFNFLLSIPLNCRGNEV